MAQGGAGFLDRSVFQQLAFFRQDNPVCNTAVDILFFGFNEILVQVISILVVLAILVFMFTNKFRTYALVINFLPAITGLSSLALVFCSPLATRKATYIIGFLLDKELFMSYIASLLYLISIMLFFKFKENNSLIITTLERGLALSCSLIYAINIPNIFWVQTFKGG